MSDEYDEYMDKPVYCYICSRKMGYVMPGEKFPPKDKRKCSMCLKKTAPKSSQERKDSWKQRTERKRWNEQQLAEERAERQRQQTYVRVPRYVIARLMEVAPLPVQDELAEEYKALIEDPLPDDKKIDVPTDWLRRKQGRL